MVKTRIEVFPDIQEQIDFLAAVPEYDIAMYTHKKMKTNAENSLQLLKEVLPVLEAQEAFDNDSLFAALSAFGKEHEYKTGFVMWPLRTAVSGKQATPGGATELRDTCKNQGCDCEAGKCIISLTDRKTGTISKR